MSTDMETNWYGFRVGCDNDIKWIKAESKSEAVMLLHRFCNSNWANQMFDSGRVHLVDNYTYKNKETIY